MRLPRGYKVLHEGTTENADGTFSLVFSVHISRWRMALLCLRAVTSVRVRFR